MHLADAFIQNDLQCIQAIRLFIVCKKKKKKKKEWRQLRKNLKTLIVFIDNVQI